MLRNILPFLFIFCSVHGFSQNSATEIGMINNGAFVFNENQNELIKAFEWTFKDGTKVTELKIEQLSNGYYLVATCNYQGRKRMAAVDIDLVGIRFLIDEEAQFKICSAVACETCRFFFENNKIVACKCEETGTISNHCHYKSTTAVGFYANLMRAIRMSKDN